MSAYPDVLPVLHPVPVRFLPRRGRAERMAYAQATTPVRLTRTDPRDLGSAMPGRLPDYGSVLYSRIEGRVFTKASAPDGLTGRSPDLATFLSGVESGARRTQMALAFAGTPVSARLNFHDGSGREWPFADVDHRGEAHLLEDAREVTHDGTEAAAQALQAFFDASVRLVGRTVYVDTGGPLFTPTRDRHRRLSYRPNLHPRMREGHADDLVGPFTREETLEAERRRVEDLRAAMGGEVPEDEARVPGVPGSSSLGRGVATDTDLLFANKGPGRLLDVLAPVVRAGARGALGDASTRAGIERLHWMALRGAVGMVEAEEAPEVVAHVAEVATWGLAMAQVRDRREGLAALRDHCREWVLPRLAAATAAIGEEDVLALDALRM